MTNELECRRCGGSYDRRSRGCEACGLTPPTVQATVQQALAPLLAESPDVLAVRSQLAQPFRLRPEGWMLH